ncbi:MAG TPA: hypothetical protein VLM79_01605 [Kofleriaceae bacterium]|nr:hypothetical protein [Kofleriaceae bacterium]
MVRARPSLTSLPALAALAARVALVGVVGIVGLGACGDPRDAPPNMPPAGGTTGGDGTTFNHDNSAINIWDYIDRLNKEGPLAFTSRMHSCKKLPYATLGSLLTGLGVDLTRSASGSAGALYRDGRAALGAADYPNRREGGLVTTAAAARQLDIFLAAADEIIAAIPMIARCKIGGAGVQLFDTADHCLIDGIACLIGVPAQQAHVDQCNATITRASSHAAGKRLAVAALLGASYTCE